MSRSSVSIIKEMSDTLNYLTNLEHEFVSLKTDTNRLEMINNEINSDFKNFSMMHLKSAII